MIEALALPAAFIAGGATLGYLSAWIHDVLVSRADRVRLDRLVLARSTVDRLRVARDRGAPILLEGDGATLHVTGGVDATWLLEARTASSWHPSKGGEAPS